MAVITGDNTSETLSGGSASDTITGRGGDDRISGGNGADTISAGAGNDTVFAGAGADRVEGGAGDDSIRGGDGDDTIFGGIGDDTIFGDAGNDRILGGTGSDFMSGGIGDDAFVYKLEDYDSAAVDIIRGGDGFDELRIEANLGSDPAAALETIKALLAQYFASSYETVDFKFDELVSDIGRLNVRSVESFTFFNADEGGTAYTFTASDFFIV